MEPPHSLQADSSSADQGDQPSPKSEGGRAISSSGVKFELSAAQATVAAAVFAMIGAVVASIIQFKTAATTESLKSQSAITLDRQKFETTLVLKAIDTPNEDDRIKNLKFFIAAGFISDPDGKIQKMVPADYPSLSMSEHGLTRFDSAAFSSFPKPLIELLKRVEGPAGPLPLLMGSADIVSTFVTASLNENQQSAIISMVYHVGAQRFLKSQLLSDINQGHSDKLTDDCITMNTATGYTELLSKTRCTIEVALFNKIV